MKRIFLVGALALFGLSNAQIAKGTTYVSGVVGYSGEKNNNTEVKMNEISIVPKVGHFVGNNLAVGLGVGYNRSTQETPFSVGDGSTERIDSGVVVEPFVRKYWTLGEKLYFFGELAVPMNFGKSEVNITGVDSEEVKRNTFGVAVKPGLDYFLNKNWTLEASIGEFSYSNSKLDVDGAKSNDTYKFGFNLASVQFGVKYVFDK